jgi:hypothetical protein
MVPYRTNFDSKRLCYWMVYMLCFIDEVLLFNLCGLLTVDNLAVNDASLIDGEWQQVENIEA